MNVRKNKRNKTRSRKPSKGGNLLDEISAAKTRKLENAKLTVWWGKPPARLRRPRGPSPGADFTTVQLVTTFSNEVGLTSGSIVAVPTTNTLGTISVELGDFVQASAFATIFDQYRIEKLHFRLTPDTNVRDDSQAASPNQSVPFLAVVVDHDDASAPASFAALQEYDNVETATGWEGLSVELTPSVTPAIFASGAFNAYEVVPSDRMWLDIANTTCPHYGIKFGVTALQATSTNNWLWSVQCWVQVSFKNVR
jgi:hypothetical protein